ncbi:cytochrome c oxidase subunit II [Phytoactinopolyspora halotolerans]|uniref:cytochrome-c oxidase n=1 Tax=Phytoactinopolyspora halotolerans TaxID=1981512 RepID=A0A6L9SBU3_9ACTN|nr:cytochrome c oxidase subunit II [Phytoactinopolyspora halotolerans]
MAACDSSAPSTLSPAGPAARQITGLWWLLFWISAVVSVVVFVLLGRAVLRGRRAGERVNTRSGNRFVLIMGVALPVLVLAGVYVVGLRDMRALQHDGEPAAYTVEVVGHKWWWEVRYPDDGAVTANEIHIPAGEPVDLELTTEDVNHSLWVPELAPKVDLIAGRTNTLRLEADEPGEYRGQCAEFCGLQHANMAFIVVAHPPEEFRSWLANESEPAPEPDTQPAAEGLEVLESSSCATCHTVRGTEAGGTLGPDLTHLAGRRYLGAGAVPNNPGHLAGWISDAQSIKPGNEMPPQPLPSEDLQALLAYLETLE